MLWCGMVWVSMVWYEIVWNDRNDRKCKCPSKAASDQGNVARFLRPSHPPIHASRMYPSQATELAAKTWMLTRLLTQISDYSESKWDVPTKKASRPAMENPAYSKVDRCIRNSPAKTLRTCEFRLRARYVSMQSPRKSLKQRDLVPPMTSMKPGVSLKGADSKPRFPPGLLASMKPKSTWIKRPWASRRMFPLCLRLMEGDEGSACGTGTRYQA